MQSAEYMTPLKKSIVVGFSQLGTESAWRMANTTSIQDAAKESGITLILKNAEQSQTKQFEAVRSFIRQKVDVIAIAPVVESGWDDILQEAKRAGIPVIIVDRSVDVQDSSLFVTTIGSDFYEEGVKAGSIFGIGCGMFRERFVLLNCRELAAQHLRSSVERALEASWLREIIFFSRKVLLLILQRIRVGRLWTVFFKCRRRKGPRFFLLITMRWPLVRFRRFRRLA